MNFSVAPQSTITFVANGLVRVSTRCSFGETAEADEYVDLDVVVAIAPETTLTDLQRLALTRAADLLRQFAA
ncbi:MAG: hypothetical protein AB7N54_19785 [Alphaproteobacteria bacterium]